MINRRQFVASSISVLLSGALAACSSNSTKSAPKSAAPDTTSSSEAQVTAPTDAAAEAAGPTIVVGALPALHAEILRNFAIPHLEAQGVILEVREYPDAAQANAAVIAGEIDANYCQHSASMEGYNKDRNAALKAAGLVHYHPVGIYSKKHDSLRTVTDDATVVFADDDANRGRALQLLQQEGLIKLEVPDKLDATTGDVVENLRNLDLQERAISEVSGALSDADLVVLNSNYAIDAGLHVSDALTVEANDGKTVESYAHVICCTEPMLADDRVIALTNALHSDLFAHYLYDAYNQDVLPAV